MSLSRMSIAAFFILFIATGVGAQANGRDPDINGDGVVNNLDLSVFSGCFGKNLGVTPECRCADVDENDLVDSRDVNVVVAAYGQSGFPLDPEACSAASNRPPQANAGPDQTAAVLETVSLDGSGSTDADADPLTFAWSLTSLPPGSVAALSDPQSVMPRLLVDVPGRYVAQLVVSDGMQDSAPDTVVVTTRNSAPIADAGPDQTVFVLDVVQLDGAGSSDVDGDSLSFRWSFVSVPTGSAPVLSNASTVSPFFDADFPGTYVLELVVNDGAADSAGDTVVVTTDNTAPVAQAGNDQSAFVGDTVILDGSGSSDVDGDALTFAWSFTSSPPGSVAIIEEPASPMPSFEVDLAGTYVAQLIVNDGLVDSHPDTITVTTENSSPVADAGIDQSVLVGDSVFLDGSGSFDLDSDTLTYSWSLTVKPDGSLASFDDPNELMPSFVVDVPGSYVAQLIVNDGRLDSDPDTVSVTTDNSAPVAEAGPDQSVPVTETVSLDGSGSFDVDFDPLTFHWSFTTVPSGSAATLSDVTEVSPFFIADRAGTYVVQLIVNDGALDSLPDTVVVVTENSPPIASAGADQTAFVGDTVTLDGTGSSDADGDALTFRWSLTVPMGSSATLSDEFSPTPTFFVDKKGDYIAQLIVNDGAADSPPDTVTSTILNSPPVSNAGPNQTVEVTDTVTLDGSGSFDVDGDALIFQWSFSLRPGGSTVTLDDASAVMPSFVPDTAGTFELQLMVSDAGGAASTDTVSITAIPQTIGLALIGDDVVGLGRTLGLEVLLPSPAPAAGATVAVTSDNTGFLTVSPPGIVTIPEGKLKGQTSVNGVGIGLVNLTGTATGFRDGTLAVEVTPNLIQLPDEVDVPLGQLRDLLVTITPGPAPPGGLQVRFTSSDPEIVAVSSFVTILEGDFTAKAAVTGASPGTATVTASHPLFSNDQTIVHTTAELDVSPTNLNFNEGLPKDIVVRLKSGGSFVPAPPRGLEVTLVADDPTCVSVTSPQTLDAGVFSFTTKVTYAGSASLPCATRLTASAPGVTPASNTIDIDPRAGIALPSDITVGAALESAKNKVKLGAANHGGVTLHLEVSEPSLALISASSGVIGSQSIDVPIDDGQIQTNFVIQGIRTGSVDLTASAPGFTSQTVSVAIVEPRIEIAELVSTIDTLDAPDQFHVRVGVGNSIGLTRFQKVSPANTAPVEIDVSTDDSTVGQITFAGTTAGSVSVLFPVGTSLRSVFFQPISPGTATVAATGPGFLPTTRATDTILVTTPNITLPSSLVVGARLESPTERARLGAANHGGVTVHLELSDSDTALISAVKGTVGEKAIDVPLDAGQTEVLFVVQGLQTGSVELTVSAPGFASNAITVPVVPPRIEIAGLASGIDTLDPPDAFQVNIGVGNGTGLTQFQVVSPANTAPVAIDVFTDEPTIGQITYAGITAGAVSVPFAIGTRLRAVSFQPIGPGISTVSASSPGFISTARATDTILVTTPGITLPSTLMVGAGLESPTQRARLGAASHGGVTMHLELSDPTTALISTSSGVVGGQSIDLPLLDGQTDGFFVIQGVQTGSVELTVSAPGFASNTVTISIVRPSIEIFGLIAGLDTLDAPDLFQVLIGVGNGTGLTQRQAVSPANTSSVAITLSTDDPTIGQITFSGNTAESLSIPFPVGTSLRSVLFQPVGPGISTVTASSAGFISTTRATDTILVTTPTIRVPANGTIGAGLQAAQFLTLSAANHGGVDVRIESSNPLVLLVAPDGVSLGADFIDVFVPDGATRVNYVLQGVEGATGGAIVTTSASRFADGNTGIEIVTPAVGFTGLRSDHTTGINDQFVVRIGVPNSIGTQLSAAQDVNPSTTIAVTATVSSSEAAVGELVGAGTTGGAILVTFEPGVSTKSFVFVPIAPGTTTVNATVPGFLTTTSADTTVSVSDP